MFLRYIFVFIFTLLIACQSTPPVAPVAPINASPKAKAVVLNHKYFEVHYLPEYKLAKFVKYTLTAQNLKNRSAIRKNKFFVDPLLKQQNFPVVPTNAYSGSQYHRGHMAPAEDFRFSQEAINTTFVMTNMAPQRQSLNAGAWKRLEAKVRRMACGEEKVTVITGPILHPELQKLPSGVSIPEEFFKVVIDETPPTKAVAFILKQTDRGNVIDQRRVSFSELQAKTNENFVPHLAASEDQRHPAQTESWKEADCN